MTIPWLRDFVVDCSPDPLVVLDPGLRVVWANPAAERFLGHPHGDLWMTPVLDFVHPEDLPAVLGGFSSSSQRGGDDRLAIRIRVRRRAGEWIATRSTSTSVDVDGHMWTVLSIRSAEDEVAVEDRRRQLRGLAQSIYIECAGLRHEDEETRSTAMLGTLASVVGAQSAELAEVTGVEPELLVIAAWARRREDLAYGTPGVMSRRLGSTGLIERSPCVLSAGGGRTWVEIDLPEHYGHSGVVCLGFDRLPDSWDDANADLLSLMCSTLLATVIRCRHERRTALAATYDPLTGLLNRRALHEHLGAMMNGQAELVGQLSLVFAGLNDLKLLNYASGHHEGDKVLLAAAEAIDANTRDGDIASRFGGDEFVVVARSDRGATDLLVHRLRESITEALLPWPGMGVAIDSVAVSVDDTPEDALRRADLAMYLDRARQKEGRSSSRPGVGTGLR